MVRAKYLSTLILVFTLLLTVCTGSVGWAQAIDFSKPYARMGVVTVGAGVAAAGCSQSIIADVWGAATTPSTMWAPAEDRSAFNYVAGSSGTYTIRTVSVPISKKASPTGNLTVYLCADDTGKPVADASCKSFGTYDAATLPDTTSTYGYVYISLYDSAGFSNTAASTYWVKVYFNEDDTNMLAVPVLMTGTQASSFSANDSSWTSYDSSCTIPYRFATCQYATGETPVQGYTGLDGTYAVGNATRYALAGGIVASENYCMTGVKMQIKKVDGGSLDGTVSVKVYASDGTKPTGDALGTASETLTAASVTTSFAPYSFTFSSCINLTKDTEYFVSLESDTLNDSSNYFMPAHVVSGANDLAGNTGSWANLDSSAQMSMVLLK